MLAPWQVSKCVFFVHSIGTHTHKLPWDLHTPKQCQARLWHNASSQRNILGPQLISLSGLGTLWFFWVCGVWGIGWDIMDFITIRFRLHLLQDSAIVFKHAGQIIIPRGWMKQTLSFVVSGWGYFWNSFEFFYHVRSPGIHFFDSMKMLLDFDVHWYPDLLSFDLALLSTFLICFTLSSYLWPIWWFCSTNSLIQ